MLRLRRPELVLLEDIMDELRLFGRISWVKWFKLRSNIDYIEECRRKVSLIKDLSHAISLFGSDVERVLFLSDYCSDLCYRVCDNSSLEAVFDYVLSLENPYLRRFLAFKAFSYGFTAAPEETLSYVEEKIYDRTNNVSLEDKLLLSFVTASYDFGYADDFFVFILRIIHRMRDAKNKALNLARFAYYFSLSFRDKESEKIAKDSMDTALKLSDFDPYTKFRVLPYLFNLSFSRAEKYLDRAISERNIGGIRILLDEGFLVLRDTDVYHRLLSFAERLLSSDKISLEEYLDIVSRIIRDMVVIDPYMAQIIFVNNQQLLVGMPSDDVDLAINILRNVSFADLNFVFEMTKIIVRENESVVNGLKLLNGVRDILPRRIDELFRYEIRSSIKKLRIDELIEISDLLYALGAESARKIVSKLVYQVDKSEDYERKISRLLRISEKIKHVDPARTEQLCVYAYELSENLSVEKRVKITTRIIDILESINTHYALEILQDTIELAENTKNKELLENLNAFIKKKNSPSLMPVTQYIINRMKKLK